VGENRVVWKFIEQKRKYGSLLSGAQYALASMSISSSIYLQGCKWHIFGAFCSLIPVSCTTNFHYQLELL
jgi:hypothetical protein